MHTYVSHHRQTQASFSATTSLLTGGFTIRICRSQFGQWKRSSSNMAPHTGIEPVNIRETVGQPTQQLHAGWCPWQDSNLHPSA